LGTGVWPCWQRDSKGKILKMDLQSKELPSTRITPDRRWFGNTRVIGQKQLEAETYTRPFSQLNISTFCDSRWLVSVTLSVTKAAQVELKSGRV